MEMNFKNVFDIIFTYTKDYFKSQDTAFYALLEPITYANISNENIPDHDYVKNHLRTGLQDESFLKNYTEAGFLALYANIHTIFIIKLNAATQRELCDNLLMMLEEDTIIPEEFKKDLASIVDYSSSISISCFIAACILTANHITKIKRDKQPRFTLGTDFIKLCSSNKQTAKDIIWNASKNAYINSHSKGNRFGNLQIIESILPNGYNTDVDYYLHIRTVSGDILPLVSIYEKSLDKNISIIGEGGIGKTTFLQHLLQQEFCYIKDDVKQYREHCTGNPVPIFIELNRCTSSIINHNDTDLHKSNFITRYVASLIDNTSMLDDVKQETIDLVENEFHKTPSNQRPNYLLLLDGFNEVQSNGEIGRAIRNTLSNEISVLSECPNIRIIATTRETTFLNYAKKFENIYLVGLTENDIVNYLHDKANDLKYTETQINTILSKKELVKCLRIPLFLSIFSNTDYAGNLPETQGEILYYFFHRESSFYNIRQRSDDTHTNPLDATQTALVLDFIIPYIGMCYEYDNLFVKSSSEFKICIDNALNYIKTTYKDCVDVPFRDFNYSSKNILKACESLISDTNGTERIIACLHDFLGVFYTYTSYDQSSNKINIHYSFIHHHFRDYFSAMHDVQNLLAINYVFDAVTLLSTLRLWPINKATFISQILMEHKNAPVLDDNSNWILPYESTKFTPNPEQLTLIHVLDFLRTKQGDECYYQILLNNILKAILIGRQEFSGLNLSCLDLYDYSIFGTRCSKRGLTETLAANFDNSIISRETFKPVEHEINIKDYYYSKSKCYTLDAYNNIKCWDPYSKTLIFSISLSSNDTYKPDQLHWCVSEDNDAIAFISSYNKTDEFKNDDFFDKKIVSKLSKNKTYNYIKLYNTKSSSFFTSIPGKYKNIIDFSYSNRCSRRLYVASQDLNDSLSLESYIYVVDYELAPGEIKEMFSKKICLDYGEHISDYFKIFDFNCIENKFFAISSTYQKNIDYYDYDYEEPELISGDILIGDIKSLNAHSFYSFAHYDNEEPVYDYNADNGFIIVFDAKKNAFVRINLLENKATPIFKDIIKKLEFRPTAIKLSKEPGKTTCFIISDSIIYEADYIADSIITTHSISDIYSEQETDYHIEDLTFHPKTNPDSGLILLESIEHMYEWDYKNSIFQRSYDTHKCNSLDLKLDDNKKYAILVNQYDGLSVFHGKDLDLLDSVCFPYSEYTITSCSYSSENTSVALLFSKPTHAFVLIYNIEKSVSEIIYSTKVPDNTICSVDFSEDGKHLLVVKANSAFEYSMLDKKMINVQEAYDDIELFQGRYVNNTYIDIIHKNKDTKLNSCPFICFRYKIADKNNSRVISKSRSYYPPLASNYTDSFIPFNKNEEVIWACDDFAESEYRLFSGLFTSEEMPKTILLPTSPRGGNNSREPEHMYPYDIFYCYLDEEVDTDILDYNCGYKIDNERTLIMNHSTKQVDIISKSLLGFSKETIDNLIIYDEENAEAYSSAIPWSVEDPNTPDSVVVVSGFNNLCSYTANNRDIYEYKHGISINKCSFKDIETNRKYGKFMNFPGIDRTVIDLIEANGGIVDASEEIKF